MNEIRQLRLIVNNIQFLSRSHIDSENFPKNGARIMQVEGQQAVALKISRVNETSKVERTPKEEKKKKKYTLGKDNLINLKI